MDSFEFNKMAGAVLGTLLFLMGIGIVSDGIFSKHPPAKPGYDLPGTVDSHGSGAAVAATPAEPLPALLAKADPKKGEAAAKVCTTCHTFEKGGAPKPTGPDLAGVVGRPLGSTGFSYSDSMKAHGGNWTYENLNAFLANPKALVPNTKMAYGGERDPAKRADIIAYLRSITDNPPALPTP